MRKRDLSMLYREMSMSTQEGVFADVAVSATKEGLN